MGSASSKAARKLPKRTEIPSWTSGTTQAPNVNSVKPETRSTRPLASEEKDEAIMNDAADPHFLSNLNRLGPVSINQPLQPVRSAAAVKSRQLLESRMRSDRQEIAPAQNEISASTLSFLLNQRKSSKPEELESLVNKYGISLSKLESIARYVNSPSIQSSSAVRTVGQDGEEKVTVMACHMLKRFHTPIRVQVRNFKTSPAYSQSGSRSYSGAKYSRFGLGATSVAVAATILLYSGSQRVIRNDTETLKASKTSKEDSQQGPKIESSRAEPDKLQTLVWGSNQSKLLSVDDSDTEHYRTPQIADWLSNVALRDLAFHKNHAACVDARGDVYQWGEGFSKENKRPLRTLSGKDIIQIQLADSKIYALSRNGNIYTLGANATQPGTSSKEGSSWWKSAIGLGQGDDAGVHEIRPREALSWGERFTSISAGNDHLLALTSSGRAFAHPITKDANAYGQLGFRKVELSKPSNDNSEPVIAELIPKSISDPYAKSTPTIRASSQAKDEKEALSDWSCSNIFEIPSLKGIKLDQLVAGGRSSFALTKTGRVLGWGANEYGQIGLGNNVTVDTITVPTEVVLWRPSSPGSQTRCVRVNAGGDLTAFTVEVQNEQSSNTVDVLMCGNGQWGGLGNNIYSNAQGTPIRARNVSGLLEYNDLKRSLQPIPPHAITVSPTGHVLLTLDTSNPEGSGRDLVAWGKNYDSELGNGKRSSVAVPVTMQTPEGERFMLRKTKAKEVLDLQGNRWKKQVLVEQRHVAGITSSTDSIDMMSTNLSSEIMLSPTLTATSSSSFDMIDEPRSRSSTISNLSAGDDSDDEIVWQVSPTHRSTIDTSATDESDDDFVVLSRRPRSPLLRSTTPSASTNAATSALILTAELEKLTLRTCESAPTKATAARPSTSDTRSSTPSGSELSASSKRRARRKAKKLRNAGNGLGARPIVDDVSEVASDNGDHEVGQKSAYDDAVNFVNMFLTNPDAYNTSSGRLTLLQSIIVELGLAKSVMPASLKAAKALIKSHAFVNIREYIAVREQGVEAVQQIMHPSRSALARSIRKSNKRASLQWVKEHGLQVLLVSCYHH
ncbi:hypothetical protein VNI00_008248 [Paramarasmius palmivorus]|uniref:Uncharacterized protein n=1 Tax=Paramarasmius palmivorus TaxID=297713 RepID=A0AAW0CWZ0_9AGAR